jgi:hypothetical protein
MAKEWRILFLIHLIVGLVFGLGYIVLPDLTINLLGLTGFNPWLLRIVGAAILGYSASSWYGMQQTSYERIRGIVIAEIVWTTLGALVSLLGVLFAGQPASVWLNVIALGAFAVAFIWLAAREQKAKA